MIDPEAFVCSHAPSQMLYAFISALQTSFHYSLRELTTFCLWMVLCIHDSPVAKVSERTLQALCSLLGTFRAGRGQAGPNCKQGRQSLGNTPSWSGGPHRGEELAVTGKPSMGRYPCPTRVQIQGNAWSSTKGMTVEFLWLPSTMLHILSLHIHTDTHTSVLIHRTFMALMPSFPVSKMNLWPKSGQAEQHIPLASVMV